MILWVLYPLTFCVTTLNTKESEVDEDESEEDFQKRVEEAVQNMKL
ncbi:hypothetical protein PDIG_21930 [Penicillium digitatum PHI26]|uniref:Uncharacterized protein n=2 Tax=Penicillium digitatum TaxID=36651 RepID=K9G5B3_PEND2|nr:hypothetical protein PDIP_24210 [Penicillium digitatum Pd1]EKV16127.1 hypothetical protein PDIG_21930 [Penicillium digitatum PHI26]EKV19411.1 hypothetical protein PDIP_24210 [Penicillium digitatum Pd1]